MSPMRRILTAYPMLKRVVVNLKTGQAFDGVLWRRRGPYLVLRDARTLARGQAPLPVVGEVVIPADNVDFMVVS